MVRHGKQTSSCIRHGYHEAGGRVAATAVTGVSRGKRGIVREPAIVAQKLTEAERDELGLLEVGDYGFSGHKVYVIA